MPHTSAFGLRIQGVLLADDVGVASQIAERDTSVNRRLRQFEIEKIRNGA